MNRSASRRACVLAAAIAAGACGPVSAQSSEESRPDAPRPAARPVAGRVSHVHLTGDLEAIAPVRRLGEVIDRAGRDGDSLVVLELDGDRGRLDVALALVDVIRGSATPIAVYLADGRDHRVGCAQLCVAVAARDAVIEPGTGVRSEPGDGLRDLAPDKTDWERVVRELSGTMYASLRERGGPGDLAQAIVGGAGDDVPREAWAVFAADGAGEAKVVFEDPGRAEGGGVVWALMGRSASGLPRLSLSSEQLRSLRAVRALAASAGGVPAALGIKGSARPRATIDATIGRVRADVENDLNAADDLLRRATDDLDLPKPPRADVSDDVYRRAARAAREKLKGASERLVRSERVVEEYPELARTAAPGQTDVAGTPSVYAARWRAAFQKKRDQVRKLEEKCATFESPDRK